MTSAPRLLAQNLGGIQPITRYGEGANTNEGALSSMESFISTMIGVITVGAGIFFVVNFLIAALNWISAGGDSGKVASARDKMIQSAVGLIIVVAAYAIMGIVGTVVGLDVLNPAETLNSIIP